ncbi:MAG: orotidine-5'-phosphate decarboxylase [Chloroflexi bacterium]|nr:orotidine-5'-phosphate decarboxylase [Chloroflexota bacterium]
MICFDDLLNASARKQNSLLCVGLDPRAPSAAIARDECLRLIDETAEAACAFKPNSAFFEMFLADGMFALHDVIRHVPDGIPVILDAKRGDIGDTAAAYAHAAFDGLGANAVTVSPYIGSDAVAPFIVRPEYGAFILCKTSNAGGDEFQNMSVLDTGGRPAAEFFAQFAADSSFKVTTLYEQVALHAQAWNTHRNVGLVVGATYPEVFARVRALAPDLWFLVPGVGTQGGDLRMAVEHGIRADGLGVLISASRSIARAHDPRAEALRTRDAINAARRS